ncbi:MAG: putative PurR-regulated permease PerM, partial [Saprospiraceae bacterium]
MKNISRYIVIAVSILIIAAIIYLFSDIVAYVLIAWVLSMIGQPMMRFFQKNIKIGKFQAGSSISAILTMLCYIIIFTALLWMFVPLVVQQARNLTAVDYNLIGETLKEPLDQINTLLVETGLIDPGQSPTEQLTKTMKKWFSLEKMREFLSSIFAVAGDFIFAFFSVVFILYFFLKDQGLFVNFLVAMAPNKYGEEVKNALDRITKLLRRYFGGILLQMTIITIFISVLLGLLGVKNALL